MLHLGDGGPGVGGGRRYLVGAVWYDMVCGRAGPEARVGAGGLPGLGACRGPGGGGWKLGRASAFPAGHPAAGAPPIIPLSEPAPCSTAHLPTQPAHNRLSCGRLPNLFEPDPCPFSHTQTPAAQVPEGGKVGVTGRGKVMTDYKKAGAPRVKPGRAPRLQR
jgi:hypothetical protein